MTFSKLNFSNAFKKELKELHDKLIAKHFKVTNIKIYTFQNKLKKLFVYHIFKYFAISFHTLIHWDLNESLGRNIIN